MAIESRTFGVPAGGAQPGHLFGNLGAPDRKELPKAQTWLNVGYVVGTPGEDDYRFVSLPVGIPLDTMEGLPIRSDNDFGKFTAARNNLMQQLQERAAQLEPGDEALIGLGNDSGLVIQLRRVNGPVEAPATDESNPYARQLFG
jgi:hypothetical protein